MGDHIELTLRPKAGAKPLDAETATRIGRAARSSAECLPVEPVPLGDSVDQLEMTRRGEQFDVGGLAVGDGDVAVRVVDRLVGPVPVGDLDQVDRERGRPGCRTRLASSG